jgi:hypothetical protein
LDDTGEWLLSLLPKEVDLTMDDFEVIEYLPEEDDPTMDDGSDLIPQAKDDVEVIEHLPEEDDPTMDDGVDPIPQARDDVGVKVAKTRRRRGKKVSFKFDINSEQSIPLDSKRERGRGRR